MARDHLATARKLRALTASPNEHEAARAREKYQAYTARHRIRLENQPVVPRHEPVLRAWAEWLAWVEGVQRAIAGDAAERAEWDRRRQAAMAEIERLEADTEYFEIEYLRRLPVAKREAKLRVMPPAKQARYRLQFEILKQASRRRRRKEP